MEQLILFLYEQKINFSIGIIKDDIFFKIKNPTEDKKAIKIQWKKESINKLINKLNKKNIYLHESKINKYNALYNVNETENKLLIEYVVDSHVQLPKLLLKNFRTNYDLYYLDTNNNEIKKSSARNYNTKFGYYSLFFEDYLSNNYESIISKIINTLIPFVNRETDNIRFKNLDKNVNKLFLMAIFRNPKQIEDINKQSTFSCILPEGYTPELIAFASEDLKENFIKGFRPIPLINTTDAGLITLKSLVTNLYIDNKIEGMIIPLHPKFAIALIPDDYYKEMRNEQGDGTYLLLDKEENLLKLNKQIYRTAKFGKEDVIGIKEDLNNLIKCIGKDDYNEFR